MAINQKQSHFWAPCYNGKESQAIKGTIAHLHNLISVLFLLQVSRCLIANHIKVKKTVRGKKSNSYRITTGYFTKKSFGQIIILLLSGLKILYKNSFFIFLST